MHNELRIERGTSQMLALTVYYEDGTDYIPQEGDVLRFGVKLDKNQSTYDIIKTGSYDTDAQEWIINLTPSDTAELEFGRYYYDIGLQTSEGEYYMVVKASWFWVDTAITGVVTS